MTKRGFSRIPISERRKVKKRLSDLSHDLQKRREELGFTQESFSEHIDLSVGSIKTIEQGIRLPSLPVLIWLAGALELDVHLVPKKKHRKNS